MEQQKHEKAVGHCFDSYCKKILKYRLINWHRERKRQSEREVTFSDMSMREYASLAVSDEYFAGEYLFCVLGKTIVVSNADLAKALSTLPADKLEIVLMSYYLDMNDREIAERLNMVRGTVNYRRNRTLENLKQIIESVG